MTDSIDDTSLLFTRRNIVSGLALSAAAVATGCTTGGAVRTAKGPGRAPKLSIHTAVTSYPKMYGPVTDGGFRIPGIPLNRVPDRLKRQIVNDPTGEAPGTVVVDTRSHYLYLVYPGRKAVRYGVGLGRAGFEWSGRAVVQWKRKWPTWTPPDEMIARQPELAKYSADNGGMKPGLKNPLGARALYIFQNGEDTLYRLHGSPEWQSIGRSVSSGCVRLMNQDVIDLYERVRNGSPILVR